MATYLPADLGSQRVVNSLPRSIIAPLLEVRVHTLPRWILVRQHPPLTATYHEIQDPIDDRSHVQRARSSSGLCGRNQFFDTIPLTVGQIGWIQLSLLHISSVPPRLSGCHLFSNISSFHGGFILVIQLGLSYASSGVLFLLGCLLMYSPLWYFSVKELISKRSSLGTCWIGGVSTLSS